MDQTSSAANGASWASKASSLISVNTTSKLRAFQHRSKNSRAETKLSALGFVSALLLLLTSSRCCQTNHACAASDAAQAGSTIETRPQL